MDRDSKELTEGLLVDHDDDGNLNFEARKTRVDEEREPLTSNLLREEVGETLDSNLDPSYLDCAKE